MSSESRFKPGDKVRVRAGVMDPDNPDLPIGNWCGAVEEVDSLETPSAYLLRWDQRTRDNMPPIFVKRCTRDDLEVETMWLDEPDLEPDDGTNLPIEQPKEIQTRPLNENEQDDRLLAVFGLTGEEIVPDVDEVTLRLYHAYLVTHLQFPFEGRWVQDEGPGQLRGVPVKVLRLLPPETIDLEDGLLCDVETPEKPGTLPLAVIERDAETPQGRMVDDYTYWIENWGVQPPSDFLSFPGAPGMEDPLLPGPRLPLAKLLNFAAILGAFFGATVGSIGATFETALTGMLVGSAILAVLFGMAGRRYGTIVGALNQAPRAPFFGLLVGVIVGGVFGVVLGAMAVAFVGTIAGSIVGTILGGFVSPQGKKARGKFLGGFLGACAGGVILTFSIDREKALAGLIAGTLVGAIGAIFLVLIALFTLAFLMGRRR